MVAGMPQATSNSGAYCSTPSAIRPMSQLVPPMSSVNADRTPAASAKCRAPVTPPASPESRSWAGFA